MDSILEGKELFLLECLLMSIYGWSSVIIDFIVDGSDLDFLGRVALP
jgi:hypothetical protein